MRAKIIGSKKKDEKIDQYWIDLGIADVYTSRSWLFQYFFHWPEKGIVACIDEDEVDIELFDEPETPDERIMWLNSDVPKIVEDHQFNRVNRVGPFGGYTCGVLK